MRLRWMLPFVLAGAALAQGPTGPMGPGNRPEPLAEIKEYLNLGDGQVEQIRQIQQQAMESIRGIATQLRETERILREKLSSGTTDPAEIGRLTLEAERLRKQIGEARASTRKSVRGVLTASQQEKLQELEDAAKLMPKIHQAAVLGLLDLPMGPSLQGPPAGLGGFGGGPRPGPGAAGARR